MPCPKLGMWKGAPFVNRKYTEGLPFLSKNGLSKAKGLKLGTEPPRIKHNWVAPRPSGDGSGEAARNEPKLICAWL